MECTIARSQLKAFKGALHCLSKIGDTVLVSVSPPIYFRVLSASQVSYAELRFDTGFFSEWKFTAECTCNLDIRNCLAALKSITLVDRIELRLEPESCDLEWRVFSRSGIQRTLMFAGITDSPPAEVPIIPWESFPSALTISSDTLSQCLVNLHQNVNEVSITPEQDKFSFRSYTDVEDGSMAQCLQTSYTFQAESVESYTMKDPSLLGQDVTFCLKEFRAFVALMESGVLSETNVHLLMGEPGSPLILTNSVKPGIVAIKVILGTLSTGDMGEEQESYEYEGVVQESQATHCSNLSDFQPQHSVPDSPTPPCSIDPQRFIIPTQGSPSQIQYYSPSQQQRFVSPSPHSLSQHEFIEGTPERQDQELFFKRSRHN